MNEPVPITFEEGYRRLQEIAEEVERAEIPVDRMADLFAEGKGLDRALTEHLNEQKARIEGIERGEGVQSFRVVAPTDTESGDADERDDDPLGFTASQESKSSTEASSDEDVPF